MKKLVPIITAALTATLLAVCAPAALAAGAAPTVNVTAPANKSFHKSPPAFTFTTTGVQLTKTCSLDGPGVAEFDELCSSGYMPLATLPDGQYTYAIGVINDNGSASDSRGFTIDNTAPAVQMTSGPAEGLHTPAQIVGVRVAYSDANLASVTCQLDSETPVACGNAGEVLHSFTGFGEGAHKINVTVTDKAGNASKVERNLVVDRTYPQAAITLVGGATTTRDNTPAFVITASDNNANYTTRCRIQDRVAWQDCNSSTWLVSDAIGDGLLTAELEVKDRAGNVKNATYAFELDASAPIVMYEGLLDNRTTNPRPSMVFYVEDLHETSSTCGFDPTGWDDLAPCTGVPGNVPASDLVVGQHQFWIKTTDSFENVDSTIYTFEVVAPDPDPGNGGGNGGNNGNGSNNGGGAGDKSPTLTVTAKSSKVKRKKFTLTLTTTASNLSSCSKLQLTLKPKVKKAKTVKLRSKSKLKGGVCVTTTKVKLSSKLKRKKVTVTAKQGALTKKLTIKL